jgi:hypothetical protein
LGQFLGSSLTPISDFEKPRPLMSSAKNCGSRAPLLGTVLASKKKIYLSFLGIGITYTAMYFPSLVSYVS